MKSSVWLTSFRIIFNAQNCEKYFIKQFVRKKAKVEEKKDLFTHFWICSKIFVSPPSYFRYECVKKPMKKSTETTPVAVFSLFSLIAFWIFWNFKFNWFMTGFSIHHKSRVIKARLRLSMRFLHCVPFSKYLRWFIQFYGNEKILLPKRNAMRKTHAETGCGNSA